MSALKRLGLDALSTSAGHISTDQGQTRDAFGFKWAKRDTYEATSVQEMTRTWLMNRYCQGRPERLADWLAGPPKIILDAGCGAANSGLLFFNDHLDAHDYLGVDISASVEVARARFDEADKPGDFLQADLMDLPLPEASVDFIFSEGVLHHTDDTGVAIQRLARHLKPGGHFLFYVYAKKGHIREFVDDHVRAALAPMSDADAWEALKPLTALGQALGELDVAIDVPDDIDLLGIKKGTLPLQRFFYWNVAKAFYRPELTFDEMHHINFDWYRPLNCHRHTQDEIRAFCDAARLSIDHLAEEPAGLTVVARRI
ncbi:MAG: methyltransferase domain-containing protein [Myxococcota bacterium]|nr:methyltransferase domain-containing protein [Myxococcota bacterium]